MRTVHGPYCLRVFVLLTAISVVAHAELKKSQDGSIPFAFPELAVLDRYAGPWEVVESHFNKRGEVVGTAKGIEEGVWILDRRTLRRTYTSGEEGNLFKAIGMISWDAVARKYRGTWFDNASSSGPTTLNGEWSDATRTMTYSLTSSDAAGKAVDHKVIDKFLDDERRLVSTYRVISGQVEKVIEVQFTRARPCPSNLGVIMESKPGDKD